MNLLDDAEPKITSVFLNNNLILEDSFDLQKFTCLIPSKRTVQLIVFFALKIHRLQGTLYVIESTTPTYLTFVLEIEDMRQVPMSNTWNTDVVDPCLSGNLEHLINRYVETHFPDPLTDWKKEGF